MTRRRAVVGTLVTAALLGVLPGCSSASSGGDDGATAAGGSTGTGGAPGGGGSIGVGGSEAAGSSGTPGAGGGSAPDPEPAALTGITAAHNAARAAVSPPADPAIPPLVWSPTVAAVAQAWSDNCQFEHSGGMYGENIFATSGAAGPGDVVADWVSEAAHYDYASNTCSMTCGHYTQVVWRDSQSLGCGVTDCTTGSPFGGKGAWQLWVCNYDPPGNFNGKKPY